MEPRPISRSTAVKQGSGEPISASPSSYEVAAQQRITEIAGFTRPIEPSEIAPEHFSGPWTPIRPGETFHPEFITRTFMTGELMVLSAARRRVAIDSATRPITEEEATFEQKHALMQIRRELTSTPYPIKLKELISSLDTRTQQVRTPSNPFARLIRKIKDKNPRAAKRGPGRYRR